MNIPKSNNSDMPEKGWWSFLPKKTLKWIRLGRFDRPIGFWLLLLPGWWILPLSNIELIKCLKLMFIFFIGSIVMRAAGCTINDLWDKDIDKKISRTQKRPIASGKISILEAFIFLSIMLLIGLLCLIQLDIETWIIALSSIPLVIIYPLAKRFTKWPQIFLGFTFSWSIPTAWSASGIPWEWGVFTMYVATVFWVVGYDTIYGCQDSNEDEFHGIKNSAVTAKKFLIKFVALIYCFTICLLIVSGIALNASYFWYLGVLIVTIHFIVQIYKLKYLNEKSTITIFKSNRTVGLILTLGALGNYINFIS